MGEGYTPYTARTADRVSDLAVLLRSASDILYGEARGAAPIHSPLRHE